MYGKGGASLSSSGTYALTSDGKVIRLLNGSTDVHRVIHTKVRIMEWTHMHSPPPRTRTHALYLKHSMQDIFAGVEVC
jgi:hypothetical protein